MDIYLTASQFGKYPGLATSTSVNIRYLFPKPFVTVRLVRGRGGISSSLVVVVEVEVLIGRVVVIRHVGGPKNPKNP